MKTGLALLLGSLLALSSFAFADNHDNKKRDDKKKRRIRK